MMAVAVAAVAGGCQSGGSSAGGGTTTTVTTSATRVIDTTPVSAVWAVPKAFLGQWVGVVGGGADVFDVALTIRSGKGGEEVVDSVSTDKGSGNRCESIGRMILGTENELTFAFRLTSGVGCVDDGKLATVGLRQDGAASYSSDRPGGALTGTLQRA